MPEIISDTRIISIALHAAAQTLSLVVISALSFTGSNGAAGGPCELDTSDRVLFMYNQPAAPHSLARRNNNKWLMALTNSRDSPSSYGQLALLLLLVERSNRRLDHASGGLTLWA